MKTHVIRKDAVEEVKTDWGSLQWLVCGEAGTSERMTFGRVTIRPGCANPSHHHPNCEELLFVAAGRVEHTLPEGGAVTLFPGDCIVLPAGAVHQARCVSEEEAVVLVAFSSPNRQTIGE